MACSVCEIKAFDGNDVEMCKECFDCVDCCQCGEKGNELARMVMKVNEEFEGKHFEWAHIDCCTWKNMTNKAKEILK